MTSIEKYHLFDDSPEFPNNFFARFAFSGSLNRELLTESFRAAVERQVRGRAIAQRIGSQWQWVELPDLIPEIEFHEQAEIHFEPLDLRRTPGYQAKCYIGPNTTQVTMQVHHALTDGLGGLGFVRDWMLIYDNLFHGRAVDTGLGKIRPDLLSKRNQIGLASWSYLKNLWRQPIALFGAAKFIGRRFQTLPGKSVTDVPSAVFPQSVSMTIERETVLALKPKLMASRVTLNDFLLATLFATLRDVSPNSDRRACWRVIVPISIRQSWERSMPVANRTTLVQLDRFAQETNDLLGLAQGIHFELGVIRGWMLDRMFLLAIRLMSLSNTWLVRNAGIGKPRATTLLTNLGKPFVRSGLCTKDGRVIVGDAPLVAADLLPPIRAHLPLSFSAVQYAGDLRITAHVDTRQVTQADAEQFLQKWRDQLMSLL
jgi:hypothetical protein